MKNTFCLGRETRAYPSHHIGDISDWETLRAYEGAVAHYERLFRVAPEAFAHDLHPDYQATRYATARAAAAGRPAVAVAIALILRVSYVLLYPQYPALIGDDDMYDNVAWHLARGDGFIGGVGVLFRPTGVAFLPGIVLWVFLVVPGRRRRFSLPIRTSRRGRCAARRCCAGSIAPGRRSTLPGRSSAPAPVQTGRSTSAATSRRSGATRRTTSSS